MNPIRFSGLLFFLVLLSGCGHDGCVTIKTERGTDTYCCVGPRCDVEKWDART